VIELYSWNTSNGRKIPIFLEEAGLPYRVQWVDIRNGGQFEPAFLAISPNNKIPAIVDTGAPGGPISVFESGAILVYLAEKTGQFLAPLGAARAKTLEWLFWQAGGLGPMAGQLNHFAAKAPEKLAPAIDRFAKEVRRLMTVLDRRLAEAPYLAGDDYSIADMACYPWVVSVMTRHIKFAPEAVPTVPHVQRWLDELAARPGVQRGMAALSKD
jgi:GST-like protein